MTYRNRYEARCAKALDGFAYEPLKLTYTLECTYLPDFVDIEGKRIIEAKGFFDSQDRRKILAVKRQHPDWALEIWFQNPTLKISKTSRTTYAGWCEKNGIAWKRGPSK